MSMFVGNDIAQPSRSRVLGVAWSRSSLAGSSAPPMVAVSTEMSAVDFYLDEGESAGAGSSLVRGVDGKDRKGACCATVMDWRRRSATIAIGWADGAVSLWNPSSAAKGKSQDENDQVHAGAQVTWLKWSPEGTRLLTGDSAGRVCVWKTDHRSRLIAEASGRLPKGESVACCAWIASEAWREKQSDIATAPESFFAAGADGSVFLTQTNDGTTVQVGKETARVTHAMWSEEAEQLVVLTKECAMSLYGVSATTGAATRISSVKLSMTASAAQTGISSACWAGPGLLATAANEHMVRFWDVVHDENYAISVSSATAAATGGGRRDSALRLAFGARKRVLAVGTRGGAVALFRFVGEGGGVGTRGPSSPKDWTHTLTLTVESAPTFLEWNAGEAALAVGVADSVSILTETVLQRKLRDDIAVLQVAGDHVLVQRGGSSRFDKRVGLLIKGVDATTTHLVVWNQKKVEVYEFGASSMDMVGSFPSKALSVALHGQNLLQAIGKNVEMCNMNGVPKKGAIAFSDQEGAPAHLDVSGNFLAVATTKGYLSMFKISGSRAQKIASGTRFALSSSKKKLIGDIVSIRCNADGSRVSILSTTRAGRGGASGQPDTRVHVWHVQRDEVQAFDLGPKRMPTSHFWDAYEPRLFAVEGALVPGAPLRGKVAKKGAPGSPSRKEQEAKAATTVPESSAPVEVYTFFSTDEAAGILLQDAVTLEKTSEALLGVKVPKLFFISKFIPGATSSFEGKSAGAAAEEAFPKVQSRTMRDFVGIRKVDENTRRALIKFSYCLTIGNMDEAYKAVRRIGSAGVWENMAQRCIATKRLDVAEVCLGNMGHARGAAALREAKRTVPELEAQIAIVAVQMGRLAEAEKLFVECGRYDMLNKLYQATGQWEKALDTAVQSDRINLRTTHFEYARYLETVGDIPAAIKNYEASETHRRQVPRMLFEVGRIEDLEAYVDAAGDEELTRWWGKYCEVNGEYDRALRLYTKTSDELSMVRVYCTLQNFSSAADVALHSSNLAAPNYLAQQYENLGDVKSAIQFYSKAGRYNHAVRLAKEQPLDEDTASEIVNLSLRSSKAIMIDAAQYLDKKGLHEKAVLLYQRGGNVPRALDLCFRAQLFDMLRRIADSLQSGDGDDSVGSSPEILNRCADFFVDHGQYEKAVQLYITAKEFDRALDMCMDHKVTITDDMAERITMEKWGSGVKAAGKSIAAKLALKRGKNAMAAAADAAQAVEHNKRRQELLRKLARCCKKQGSFHLATKKYTQAGDKLKAMKCLLKSGDTEKIIFFAGVSRNREIYILAANFLQNLDWHNDPEVMKSIISFYVKAKAFAQLSGFYDACAQVEIDEYTDYDKALGALKEAVKYMTKAKATDKEEKVDALQQRISLVERFIHGRKLAKSDPEESEKVCRTLLAHPGVETAIRVGDIFAQLIEHHYKRRDMELAYQLIEKMRQRNIILSPYLDQHMVDSICDALGVDPIRDDLARDSTQDDGIEEEIEWTTGK